MFFFYLDSDKLGLNPSRYRCP